MPGSIQKRSKSRRDDRCFQNEIIGNGGNHAPCVQPSRWDSGRCRRQPGVETPGYCRVVPAGRSGRDAENGNRDGRAPQPSPSRAVNGSLGWTNGAKGVWSSQCDALTIARHFNAGFNPQMIQVPQGRPTFANRNHWQRRKPCAMRSAVPVGLGPVPATNRR